MNCYRCTKTLPLNAFGKDRRKATGYNPTCKQCVKLAKSDNCQCGKLKYKSAIKCSECHLGRYTQRHSEHKIAQKKPCSKCKKLLPFAEFSLLKKDPTGRQHYCKKCQKGLRKLHACATCGIFGIDAKASTCRNCHYIARQGAGNHNWKGGRVLNSGGYVIVSGYSAHPNANPTGSIAEHRLVMSEHLGRPLWENESVHHKNGDRQDNRIENLELWSRWQPTGQRIEDKLRWAKELLKLYEPEALK